MWTRVVDEIKAGTGCDTVLAPSVAKQIVGLRSRSPDATNFSHETTDDNVGPLRTVPFNNDAFYNRSHRPLDNHNEICQGVSLYYNPT